MTPCGSCTGRACAVCSIRTGGPASGDGQPTGYAPAILIKYDPSASPETRDGAAVVQDSITGLSAGESLQLMAEPTAINAIVLENMLEGTPEDVWLIDSHDASIEGFAAQFSLNHGETVDFKINTDSTDYRIDIFRLGYYGGDGARLVHSMDQSLASAQVQPIPLFDEETRLVDAGNWDVSASWDIPADAVSGVYFALLTRNDGSGGRNMIPFIVRDDEAPSDITFQTSDTTWQAYNWWGGYNFYGGVADSGHSGRAYALSYNRPITTRDGGLAAGPQDFIFGVEYSAIRWLEQNGYDVDYLSGIDSARAAEELLETKAFLSVGHDEYWSAEQRTNVEAARDAGVNLAFLSGNEVYWEVRWENSIDGSGTPYKTMVSYKERWANADIDPDGTTSTWRDPVFGSGQPENALTGTIFTVDSYRLDTMTIPYELSNFRFWSNTGVADIQPGEVYSLVPNLLGYEWDSDLDNGFRPDGLIALSSTTLDVNTMLLDHGNTVGPGTASHSLTLYRAPSGALVFGAGTVYWTWGLDANHDNEPTPTDPNVQQAMVNLFADMGVQPGTLMQSLVVAAQTTDTEAPESVITSLTEGEYAAAQPVTISGTATDSGGGMVAVVEVSFNGGASWHRATGFENWTYSWTPIAAGNYTILSRAVDDSVNLETPGTGVAITVTPGASASLFGSDAAPGAISANDPNKVNLGVSFTSSLEGSILGIRYYKSLGDGGQHVGSLWSSTGNLLASATFTTETSSGWQTVIFDNPVSIAAGTSFVASYTSNGFYTATENYFTSAHSSGPLTAAAGNGYFTYGNENLFPATASGGSNYWVDVIYSAATAGNEAPVGVNDDGFVIFGDAPHTFSAATLLANDTDPNGDILFIAGVGAASGGMVSFDAQSNTVTFIPTAGHTGPASFGYAVSDGRGGTSSAFVHMTVDEPLNGLSLFSSADTPANLTGDDGSPVNLGVAFSTSTSGAIAAIKYYKSAADTGPHTASLWTSTGTLLATATFANETASGWQTVTFDSPVVIDAGTTYVASYHSNGYYASTTGYFADTYSAGPLTAPGGSNGLFSYAAGTAFPTSSFEATNYWVDVVFAPDGPVNLSPVAANDSGFATSQGIALALPAATLLANDTDPDGDPLSIISAGNAVNGIVAFDATANTITFTPTSGYAGSASFTYTVADGLGGTDTATVTLNVSEVPNEAPVANADGGFITQQDSALIMAAAEVLGNDTDINGDQLVVTGVGAPVNGQVTFDALTNTITFTPIAGFTGSAGFTYTVSDGRGGTSSASVDLTVTGPLTGTNLFASDALPATITVDDGDSVELGMRFEVAASGTISGIRFYKGPQNLGTHTGSLWTSTGTLLGTVVFRGETASGWQSAAFATPIEVTAGSDYVVSYHSDGYYSATSDFFASGVSNGSLTAPASGTAGGNGVYAYGSTSAFPTSTYRSTNYWVDVYYTPDPLPPNEAPTATDDGGFSTFAGSPLQITAASLLANDSDPHADQLTITAVGAASNGEVSFDAGTNIITFVPNAGYSGPAAFTYEISDGRGASDSAAVSLTVVPLPEGVSLFAADATPAIATVDDPDSVELGMKFTAAENGEITGMRFYKGEQNTGTHVGSLWTATGTRLGQVTFTNETASGWQVAAFAAPIAIDAGTTYVVSYHSDGFYSSDGNYFGGAVTNGSLTAPSSAASGGNGVFAYGEDSLFPTNSHNASNYWVDVIFNGQLAA
jgi:hypothetical protein